MGIGIYWDKLDNSAKTFLDEKHKVSGATTFAKAPVVEDKITPVEEISTFEGFNGELAVGDQSAFDAFKKLAEKQNLSANQMPKGYELPGREEVIEDMPLHTYDTVVPMSCPAPELSC